MVFQSRSRREGLDTSAQGRLRGPVGSRTRVASEIPPGTIHVQAGIDYLPHLYSHSDGEQTPWLQAVGHELAARKIRVLLGRRNRVVVDSWESLWDLWRRFQNDPRACAEYLGIEPGGVFEYITDLMETLDDLVKFTSNTSEKTYELGQRRRRPTGLSTALGLGVTGEAYGVGFAENPATQQFDDVALSAEGLPDPLHDVPHMYVDTFRRIPPAGERDGEEFEVVFRVAGLSSREIKALGDRDFRDLRRTRTGAAFTLGAQQESPRSAPGNPLFDDVAIDAMDWSEEAHQVREGLGYTSLAVLPRRLRLEDSGPRVKPSRDYFDDTYYDIDVAGLSAYVPSEVIAGIRSLVDLGASVRTRVRLDGPGDPERLLLQVKMDGGVDANGLKSAHKLDERTNMGANGDPATRAAWLAYIPRLEHSAQIGMTPWLNQPTKVLAALHSHLADQGQLPTIGPREQVLMLTPEVKVFSERSRYHLVETSSPAKVRFLDNVPAWLGELGALIESNADDAGQAEAVLATITGLRDRSLIVARCAQALGALCPGQSIDSDYIDELLHGEVLPGVVPGRPQAVRTISTREQVAQKRVVVEAAKDITDELGGQVRAMAASFAEPEPVLVLMRKLEAAASLGRSLWFDDARAIYLSKGVPTAGAPASGPRPNRNPFLINTFDFVQFVDLDSWNGLADEARDGRASLPTDAVFHAEIVNEVQIELEREARYRQAIHRAETRMLAKLYLAHRADQVANQPLIGLSLGLASDFTEGASSASGDDAQAAAYAGLSPDELDYVMSTEIDQLATELETVQFIWDQLVAAQLYVARSRGPEVLAAAEAHDVYGASWEASDMSKGERAIRMNRVRKERPASDSVPLLPPRSRIAGGKR